MRNCICESWVSDAIQPLLALSVPMVTSIASSKKPLPRPNFAVPFTSQYPEYPVLVACLIVRSVESKLTPPSLKEVLLRIIVEVGVPAVYVQPSASEAPRSTSRETPLSESFAFPVNFPTPLLGVTL